MCVKCHAARINLCVLFGEGNIEYFTCSFIHENLAQNFLGTMSNNMLSTHARISPCCGSSRQNSKEGRTLRYTGTEAINKVTNLRDYWNEVTHINYRSRAILYVHRLNMSMTCDYLSQFRLRSRKEAHIPPERSRKRSIFNPGRTPDITAKLYKIEQRIL